MGSEAVLGKPLLVILGSALPLWGLLDLCCRSRTWDKCFHVGSCICWSNENHKRFIPQVMFSFRPSLQMLDLTFSFGWCGFFLTQTYYVLLIKTTAHQKLCWTHTQIRSANSILTWLCSAFSNPHVFPILSLLFLLYQSIVCITFCSSFQICV